MPLRFFKLLVIAYLLFVTAACAEMPIGARPGGLGNAFVALSTGAIGMYHNPAGLINLNGISSEIFLGEEGFPLIENWGVFYSKSTSQNDRVGFSLLRQQREIDGTTYRSYQGIIPGVKSIFNHFTLGFNLKYLTQKSGSTSYKSKMSIDMGFLYKHGFLLIGAVAKNIIDPKMSSFPQNYVLALGLNLGFVQLEIDKSEDNYKYFKLDSENFRIGAEINPISILGLRAGWDDTGDEEFVGMGIGLSNDNKSKEISYCYRTSRDDIHDGTHWISYRYELFN